MSWRINGVWQDSGSITSIAENFWAGTDLAHLFPRPIEQAAAIRLPLTIIKLPAVSLTAIRKWLDDRQMSSPLPEDHCDLKGFIFSYRGSGTAFVAGTDPSEEQRFTIAHETAHFIADYLRPRQRVIEAMGPQITAVLDADRPPTVFERAAAILAHVRLGPHVHLLPRRGKAAESSANVEAAEIRADVLALELVAPRECIDKVLKYFRLQNGDNGGLLGASQELARTFGLPASVFVPLLREASRLRQSPLLILARKAHCLPHAQSE